MERLLNSRSFTRSHPKLCVAMAGAGLNLPVSIFRLLRAFRVLRIFGCALRFIWLLPVCGITRQRGGKYGMARRASMSCRCVGVGAMRD